MSGSRKQIKLGLSMWKHGYHNSGWLDPGAVANGPVDFNYYLDMTRTAERGLFDMAFLADHINFPMLDVPAGALGRRGDDEGFDPLTLLSALAPQTTNIGLIATASTTFSQPFHIARSFASIDWLSHGRSGWNVVTSIHNAEAQNFSQAIIIDKDKRYERAEEFVEVVAGLWDSFDPDTFMPDRATGIYFDPAKVRTLNHVGPHFSVKGPLDVRRSPQGRPIIVQAGASPEGQELAARTADVVYAAQNTIDDGRKYYKSLKDRMARYGRHPDDLKIMPGLLPVIGETEAEAKAKFRSMQELIDPLIGLEFLSDAFGDLSGHDLDGPVPGLRTDKPAMSRSEVMLNVARRNNYTIRELYQHVAIGNAHHTVVGTPKMVADAMERWFEDGAADGFNILPAIAPRDVTAFVDQVVPELQRRGLFRTAYEGKTLRENLGLTAPEPGTPLPSRR
jgi:alkanesulfonate monooxygenase